MQIIPEKVCILQLLISIQNLGETMCNKPEKPSIKCVTPNAVAVLILKDIIIFRLKYSFSTQTN